MADDKKKPEIKNPKFSPTWIYVAVILGIIGLQFFGGASLSQPEKITQSKFETFMQNGDIEKIDVVNNRNVKVFLTFEVCQSLLVELV